MANRQLCKRTPVVRSPKRGAKPPRKKESASPIIAKVELTGKGKRLRGGRKTVSGTQRPRVDRRCGGGGKNESKQKEKGKSRKPTVKLVTKREQKETLVSGIHGCKFEEGGPQSAGSG